MPISGSNPIQFTFHTDLDYVRLEEQYGGKLEFCEKIFSLFLQTIDTELDMLDQAMRVKDYANIKAVFHKIKNNFIHIGCVQLGEMCSNLEECATLEALDLESKVFQFKVAYQRKHSAIKQQHQNLQTYLASTSRTEN